MACINLGKGYKSHPLKTAYFFRRKNPKQIVPMPSKLKILGSGTGVPGPVMAKLISLNASKAVPSKYLFIMDLGF
jgi:hypothetical protein